MIPRRPWPSPEPEEGTAPPSWVCCTFNKILTTAQLQARLWIAVPYISPHFCLFRELSHRLSHLFFKVVWWGQRLRGRLSPHFTDEEAEAEQMIQEPQTLILWAVKRTGLPLPWATSSQWLLPGPQSCSGRGCWLISVSPFGWKRWRFPENRGRKLCPVEHDDDKSEANSWADPGATVSHYIQGRTPQWPEPLWRYLDFSAAPSAFPPLFPTFPGLPPPPPTLALGQHFAQIPWPHTPCKGTVNFPTPTWAEVVQKAPHPVSRVTGRGAILEASASPNTLSTASGCIPCWCPCS